MTIKTIKNNLKKIAWIYSLNAFIKATLTTYRRNKWCDYYDKKAQAEKAGYSKEEAIGFVRKELENRGIKGKKKKGSLRIFWVGAHYAQDASGFLQGLKKFGEVTTFENSEGGYGLLWPKNPKEKFNREVVRINSDCLLRQIEKNHSEKPISVLMGQMWSNVLDENMLVKIKQMGIPVVNVAMDDRLPDLWDSYNGRRMGSVGLCKGLDLVLTTSPETCLWYKLEGCQAVYWPLASDPDLFKPSVNKNYDVVFVGGNYGIRGKLVKKIMEAGVSVAAFGPGWPNGFIGAEKIAEVFGEAKIILGTGTVAYNRDIMTLKLRDFDATMAGALYITNRNPDLLELFREGEEIECFDTDEECVRKIKFYLENPEKLKAVAKAGLERARKDHTWEKRIGEALEALEIIE